MANDLKHRVAELEARLAHHERMAEEMSEVLAEQARTIDMLHFGLRRLTDRLKESEAGWDRSPQDERPPPHY